MNFWPNALAPISHPVRLTLGRLTTTVNGARRILLGWYDLGKADTKGLLDLAPSGLVENQFPCHAKHDEEDEIEKGEQFMARFSWIVNSLSNWLDQKERSLELPKVWRFHRSLGMA